MLVVFTLIFVRPLRRQMPNPALEPGEPEIPLPAWWLGTRTGHSRDSGQFRMRRELLEASGPFTQLDMRYPKSQLGRPAGPASPGVSP